MKKIDTLFLSGGGINCIAFLGVFKYLIEHNMIDQNFKNFKNIVCVSGRAFFVLPFILGYSLEMTIKIPTTLNTKKDSPNNPTTAESTIGYNGVKSI